MLKFIAEVSKPGQPRGTQDPQNRKSLLSGVRGFKSHPLHYFTQNISILKFLNYTTNDFTLVTECSEISL